MAVVTRKVGEVSTLEVEGGLSVLRYCDWLTSILGAFPDRHKDDLVRHADWSHGLESVSSRFSVWAARMAEWSQSGTDPEGSAAWSAFAERVFVVLLREQRRLEIADPIHRLPTFIGHQEMPVVPIVPAVMSISLEGLVVRNLTGPMSSEIGTLEIGTLIKEKRFGLAQQNMRHAADVTIRDLLASDGEEWKMVATRLVNICQQLSELGDVDSAAAYLAPVLDQLYFQCGSNDEGVINAARIVGVSRVPSRETAEPQHLETMERLVIERTLSKQDQVKEVGKPPERGKLPERSRRLT